jgi:hypothetical protein
MGLEIHIQTKKYTSYHPDKRTGIYPKRSSNMKTKFAAYVMVALFVLLAAPVYAWDGYDYNKGSYIEIEKGNLVRSGNDIEIYDYDSGSYKDVEVQSIHRYGSKVEVEVTDPETGEDRTFEMDDN